MTRTLLATGIILLMLFAMKLYHSSMEKHEKLKQIEAISSNTACNSAGGELVPVCMSQQPMCVVQYSDAGEPCLSSSQCIGECRLPIHTGKIFGHGHCSSSNNPCGCWSSVELGIVVGGICID